MYKRVEDSDPKPGTQYTNSAETLIELSIIHSHLMGFIHVDRNIKRQESAVNAGVLGGSIELYSVKGDVAEVIDEQTIESILQDAGVDAEYVESLEQTMGPMVSDRAKLDFFDNMKSLRSMLVENVESGQGYRAFLDKIGRDQAMARIGLAGESPYYIETVYRTNYGTAHSAGRWKAAQASPVVSMLKYMTVNDDRRTKDICEPLANTTRKKTDPFWDLYNPLNHFS